MVRGKPDFWLMLILFALVGYGLVMVFSSSYYVAMTHYNDTYYFFKKQLIWAGFGLLVFFITANIPYQLYQKYIAYILFGSWIALLLVFIPGLGSKINGADRWVQLGFFSFQPSEVGKVAALIYTASIMAKKQEHLDNFKKGLLPPLIVIGLFCFLIVIQPHYSSTVILLVTCLVIIFCAGARLKHLMLLALAGSPVMISVLLLKSYRLDRLSVLWDPWKDPGDKGYQIIQSLYAIGPGGLTGAGLGNSIQKMAYLPEAHTDFIFSVIAEELGFFGGASLILLFVLFIVRGIRIALRAPDMFGMLLGVGIITLFSIQAIFNLGVVTAMLPVTGVPLPFISYGGSSLLLNLFTAGILLNISRYRQQAQSKQKKKEEQPSPVTWV
jgi:cell division protein FtsW